MLMRDEWLAGLHTHFDDASNVLTIRQNGMSSQPRATSKAPRAAPPSSSSSPTAFRRRDQGTAESARQAGATAFPMSPARSSPSSISAASRAIESMVGLPVHPLRFRANLYVEGWPAWHEFDLLDQTLAIGDARAEGGEAHHPLRRRQRRPGNGRARPRHPAGADAPARPQRMRHLCRGDRRQHYRRRRWSRRKIKLL